MTVAELIDELRAYPPSASVYCGVFYFGGERGSYNCESIGEVESIEQYAPEKWDADGNRVLAIKLYAGSEI